MFFEVGRNAIVTHEITRKDGKNTVMPGERVKITSVYHGDNYTIVNIQPYSNDLPIRDICCDEKGPLRSCL